MADCVLCKIVAGEIPSTKVYEDEHTYAFVDTNPQAPTHLLIVPRQHFADIAEVSRHPGPRRAGAPRRLPHRVQHRIRRGADRVPRPRARARRAADGLATGLSN